MGYKPEQADAIREAIASGVTVVHYDGARTEYRSLAEMREILAIIEADLAGQAGRRPPVAGFAQFRRS